MAHDGPNRNRCSLPMKNGGSFYGLTVESYPQNSPAPDLLSQEGGENEPLLEGGMKRRLVF